MILKADFRRKLNNVLLDIHIRNEGKLLIMHGSDDRSRAAVLRCIAGLETPDEGSIVILDQTVFDSMRRINLPPQVRKVGMLTDDPALFDGMTVEENISIVLRSMGGKKLLSGRSTALQEKLHSCLEQFGLNGLGGMYPEELSPQQRYRAAFARMMAAQPQIVLLDDPFRDHSEEEFSDLLSTFAQQLEKSGIPVLFAVNADSVVTAKKRLPRCWQNAEKDKLIVTMDAGYAEYYGGNGNLQIQKTPEAPYAVVSTLNGSRLQNVQILSADVRLTDPFHAYVPAWQILFCFPGEPKWRKFDPDTSFVRIRSDLFRADKAECTGASASLSFHFDTAQRQDDRYLVGFHTGNSQASLTWTIPANEYDEDKIRNLEKIYIAESDVLFGPEKQVKRDSV